MRHCAPGNRTLGVMLPYTPLHHLLFDGAPYRALVMTSGNISEEPIVVANEEARERLAGVADAFLTHDRDIYMRTDDSVVRDVRRASPALLRRSRGYAPRTIDVGRSRAGVAGVRGRIEERVLPHQGVARDPESSISATWRITRRSASSKRRSPI